MDIGFLGGFNRIIRLRDLEAWDVTHNNKCCRIIVVDEHRPSTKEDYPWLKNGLEFDPQKNHITTYVYYNESLDESEQHLFYQVAQHFSDHLALAHCNVTVSIEKHEDYDEALDQLLHSLGYEDFDKLPLSTFFTLSQD